MTFHTLYAGLNTVLVLMTVHERVGMGHIVNNHSFKQLCSKVLLVLLFEMLTLNLNKALWYV